MQCKVCSYSLWNLPARVCPECGTAFRPSDFDFSLNAVKFCCPHCMQDYYGTGERGHLVPAEFDCVRCGRHIDMDQMVLLPRADIREDQTRAARNPWADPERSNWFRAFWQTIGKAIGQPKYLISITPPTSPALLAFLFAAVCTLVFHLLGMFAPCAFQQIGFWGSQMKGPWWTVGSYLMGWFGLVAVEMAFVVIWGLMAHAVLRASGPIAHGLSRTYHAMTYSGAWMVLGGVPCLGYPLSVVAWSLWIGYAIVMLAEAQKVQGLRAALAVLAFPLCLAILAAIILAVIVAANSL
jgi:hypothetical protein